MNRKPILIAAALAATLALAGCSSGGGSAKSEAFDFTGGGSDGFYDVERAKSIKVELPEGLLQAAGPEADALLFTSATATSVELDSPQYCAFEVVPDFKDPKAAADALTDVGFDDAAETAAAEAKAQERFDRGLRNSFGPDSAEAVLSQLQAGPSPQEDPWLYLLTITGLYAALPDEVPTEERASLGLPDMNGVAVAIVDKCVAQKGEDSCSLFGEPDLATSYEALGAEEANSVAIATGEVPANWDFVAPALDVVFEQYVEQQMNNAGAKLEKLESVPAPEQAAKRLGMPTDNAVMVSELNASAPEPGTYFTDDFLKATIVQNCAMNDMDTSDAGGFAFSIPVVEENNGETDWEPLAQVTFTPMADRTLGIGTGWVEGYAVDSNGTWLKR